MIVSQGQALSFAPQALAETIPQITNGWFYADTGLNLSNRHATFAALYRAQPSVATVVDKIANSAARLTVRLWDTTDEQGRAEDKKSPLARLLANPSTEMSPYNFWRWTFSTYEVYGEAFWRKLRDSRGRVIELIPMHPARISVKRDEKGNITYLFTIGVASAGILELPAEDVVAFLRWNPENIMRGLSRLEPLATTLSNEDAARRANQSWWKRGARPSVILKHPMELSQPAMDRIRANFDARHAGADAMGGTAVLEEGMDAQIIQLNAEEMQYIESRKLNMTEVCMVFDVPPPVVHILDHATFSNITEQMRSMYRDTMSPRLEDVESVLQYSLTQDFYPDGSRVAEFDMTDVLRGDFESRTTSTQMLRGNGVVTGNEAREIMGLPRSTDPSMEKLFANAALVELGTPAQRITVTEPVTPTSQVAAEADATAAEGQAAAAEAAASGSKALTVRSIMGRLARTKANKADLRAKLVEEHTAALETFFEHQKGALRPGSNNLNQFNSDLADLLHTFSKATAEAIGQNVAKSLGGQFDGKTIADYLASNSTTVAKRINETTAAELTKALTADDTANPADVVDGVFSGRVAARAKQIAASRVASVGGLASIVAADQSGATSKTWTTNSADARPEHAEMDGETVGVNEDFSNGMSGPGDYGGGIDEVAGCTCDLEFS